jgi:ubiquinone/menaquinone biosynthesis C-methylase UbiE
MKTAFAAQVAENALKKLLRYVPADRFAGLCTALIHAHSKKLAPADALRFLFSLDNSLYALEGEMAIAYDHGIHTKHRHTGYHQFFISRIQAHEHVLDIGCGNGALAYDIAENTQSRITAIDINETSIHEARLRYPHPNITYQSCDPADSLIGYAADVVILSNVLEHITQRVRFLQKVRNTVQPQRFLIRIPLFERDWRVPLKKELGVEWRLDPSHEIEYTVDSFREEMAAAGLTIHYYEIRWGEIWAEVLS